MVTPENVNILHRQPLWIHARRDVVVPSKIITRRENEQEDGGNFFSRLNILFYWKRQQIKFKYWGKWARFTKNTLYIIKIERFTFCFPPITLFVHLDSRKNNKSIAIPFSSGNIKHTTIKLNLIKLKTKTAFHALNSL